MKNEIAVSVIVVNYNTTRLTYDCIRSLLDKTSVSFEVIVVDNGSADRSILNINDVFPDVILIAQQENIGFGKANNVAITVAKGKYVFLINSDAYLINDAIDQFYEFMEEKDNQMVGCCGGDLFDITEKKQVSYGNFPSIAEAISTLGFKFLYQNYFNRRLSSGVVNTSEVNIQVDYLCGADMFFRKSVLDKIGAFDPRFFLYFEETELSFRMHKAGYISMLLPSAKITHLEGASQVDSAEFNFTKIRRFSGSRTLYFKICHGLLAAFVIKIIYAMQMLIFFIVKRKSGYIESAKIIIRS